MATDSATANDAVSIRRLVEDRARAVREKDIDAIAAVYATDVVNYSLAPPLQIKGLDRKAIAAWFASYRGAMECEIRDLHVAASNGVAFCHYLYRIAGTLTSGKDVNMWVRATLCLRKIEGTWLIVHGHDSEPFDMQSFQALFDLQP
jgi:uncharacterized protein (TIGR02246 family)